MHIAVLVSGAGTGLQALIDADQRGQVAPAQLRLVVCNRPGARAIERARAADIEVAVIDHTRFATREQFEAAMLDQLAAADIEAVVLVGFMRILSERFVAHFHHRIINTHPALSPAFPGTHAPAQALQYGAKVTGCTVHFVDDGVDTGPIIFQHAVDVRDDDSEHTLHTRIQQQEHRLLPTAVHLLAANRLRIDGRKVIVTPA